MLLSDLFEQAAEAGAFDIHLTPGQPPVLRIAGKLEKTAAEPLTSDAIADLVLPVLPEPSRNAFSEGVVQWAETTASVPGGPLDFHVSVFRTQGQVAASVRIFMFDLPTLEQIGGTATPLLQRVAEQKRGLVLFSGPHGSGKATTACAVLEAINASRPARIFVVEEPIGYRFVDKQGFVTRWYVGQDVDSYETAARLLWKCDPDVIYFGDLPTPEAVRHALLLADAGHLVIATLGAENVVDALMRLTASFGEARPTLQKVLARTLLAAFGQRLVVRSDRPGRAALYEVLWAIPEARVLLETGRESELEAVMDADETSRTRINAIDELLVNGVISEETAQATLAAL